MTLEALVLAPLSLCPQRGSSPGTCCADKGWASRCLSRISWARASLGSAPGEMALSRLPEGRRQVVRRIGSGHGGRREPALVPFSSPQEFLWQKLSRVDSRQRSGEMRTLISGRLGLRLTCMLIPPGTLKPLSHPPMLRSATTRLSARLLLFTCWRGELGYGCQWGLPCADEGCANTGREGNWITHVSH